MIKFIKEPEFLLLEYTPELISSQSFYEDLEKIILLQFQGSLTLN